METKKIKKWVALTKLDKTKAFKYTKDISPLDSLHKAIKEAAPELTSISSVGVSPKTNEYLRARLEKHARRKYSFLSDRRIESSVAFAMLDGSPCDVDTGKDFVLYVAVEDETPVKSLDS